MTLLYLMEEHFWILIQCPLAKLYCSLFLWTTPSVFLYFMKCYTGLCYRKSRWCCSICALPVLVKYCSDYQAANPLIWLCLPSPCCISVYSQNCDWWVFPRDQCWWQLLSRLPTVQLFFPFLEYHIHMWQGLPQFSCGDPSNMNVSQSKIQKILNSLKPSDAYMHQ